MALREILAVFGVEFDGKELEKGNAQVDQGIASLKQFGAILAGAFTLDKVKDFALGMVQQADAIGDQAARLGISTKALQEWQFAAQFADLSGEALDGIFTKLSVSAFKAEEGAKALTGVYKELNVEVENADGTFKTAGQLFEETGVALSGMADKTKATALAMQLFGRGNAQKVLQLFKDGAPGIKQLREEFEALGGAFDESFLEKAGEIDDQMHRLNVSWTTAKVRIAGVLLPAVKAITEALTMVSKWFAKTSKDTNIVEAGFVLLGISGLATVNKLLKFGQLTKIFFRWLLPIGLALIALDEIITFAQGGDTIIGRLIDSAFGAGSREKVRAFFKAVGKASADMWEDLTQRPAKFEQDWIDLTTFLRADIQELHPVFAGVFQGMLDFALLTFDILTGNWSRAGDKIAAGASLAGLMITGAFDKAKVEVLIKFAEIANAWNQLWNNAVKVASDVVKKIGDALGGDSNFIGKFFTESAEKLAGIKFGDGGAAVETLKGVRDAQGQQFKTEVSRRADFIRGDQSGAGPNVVVQSPVTINVPQGTPAQQVRAVGNAAAKGTNRGAKAALAQRGSKQ
jgi:hypothetical protein